MGSRRWLLGLLGAGAVVVAVVAIAASMRPAPSTESVPADPLTVVQRWNEARNAGDVEAAMRMLSPDGIILGFAMSSPGRRSALQTVLEGQAIGRWQIEDSGCVVVAADVGCRYRMHDELMRRLDVAVTGTHEYVVRDGMLERSERFHDRDARDRAYAAIGVFRDWVAEVHPELARVIWSEPGSVSYSSPEGAQAMLGLLDEYDEYIAR